MESVAADRSPLEDLIARVQLASERMSVTNPNRALLAEMATCIVSMARMNADLLEKQRPESRIILP